jgi:hypothetical protein
MRSFKYYYPVTRGAAVAEQQFRLFYADWLRLRGLAHGEPAREAFAAENPWLCGRRTAVFHRGYAQYLGRRAVPDTEAAFARYCAPRWRLRGLLMPAGSVLPAPPRPPPPAATAPAARG